MSTRPSGIVKQAKAVSNGLRSLHIPNWSVPGWGRLLRQPQEQPPPSPPPPPEHQPPEHPPPDQHSLEQHPLKQHPLEQQPPERPYQPEQPFQDRPRPETLTHGPWGLPRILPKPWGAPPGSGPSRAHWREINGPVIAADGKSLRYPDGALPQGQLPKMSADWLRDLCPCTKCVDWTTGMRKRKLIDRQHSLGRIRIQNARRLIDDGLEISFSGDDPNHRPGKTATLSGRLLRRASVLVGNQTPEDPQRHELHWDVKTLRNHFSQLQIPFNAWVSGQEKYVRAALEALAQTGLLLLTHVPDHPDATKMITDVLGTQVKTVYGQTWDIVNQANPDDLTPTCGAVELHQDLVYMASPPRFQVAHCIKNSVSGGELLFCDSHYPLPDSVSSRILTALASFRVLYQLYPPDTLPLSQQRKVMEPDQRWGRPRQVWWSPSLLGPFPGWAASSPSLMRTWIEAAKEFQDQISSPSRMFEYRLRPGECIIYDNLRILNGRRSYDPNSGERLFRRACIGHNAVIARMTRYRVVERLTGSPTTTTPETALGQEDAAPERQETPPAQDEAQPEESAEKILPKSTSREVELQAQVKAAQLDNPSQSWTSFFGVDGKK